MIVLWGLPGDHPLTSVYDRLRQHAAPVLFLSQWDVLHTEVELSVGACVNGVLCVKGQRVLLDGITAVYARAYEAGKLPPVVRAGAASQAWRHAHDVEDILTSWLDLAPTLIVNRPEAMAGNGSKPYQATLIKAHGFAVPESLITTDPASVLEFWERHECQVIYKSISGVRSIVSRLTSEHLKRLERVQWCPTQFQQYIPGEDYRVHVVGEEIFACRIRSDADDYRYAARQGLITRPETCRLPEKIAQRCRTLTTSLGLSVSGIDLRCAPDGTWYCFEVNPSPGFTYFQDMTDQPIDEAIARLLMAATAGSDERLILLSHV